MEALAMACAHPNIPEEGANVELESNAASWSEEDDSRFLDVASDVGSDAEAANSLETLGRSSKIRSHDGLYAMNCFSGKVHAQWANHADLLFCSRHSTIQHRIIARADIQADANLCTDCFPLGNINIPMGSFDSSH